MIDGKKNEIPGVYIDETPKIVKFRGGNPNQIEVLPRDVTNASTIQQFLEAISDKEEDIVKDGDQDSDLGEPNAPQGSLEATSQNGEEDSKDIETEDPIVEGQELNDNENKLPVDL